MNYIVMDLEWNQSTYGRAGEHPRLPFEIIEIGAVKTDADYNIISEFRTLIKPKVYTKLHHTIKDMLNYDEKELFSKGKQFKDACKEFLDWCEGDKKEEYAFCTWGMSDLYYLQSNMDFYYMEKLKFPVKYYNIQQIYADKYDPEKNICKLEKAVEFLKMDQTEPFHAAINDARYTARVMKEANLGDFSEKYSFDIYRHPKKKEEEIIDFHDGMIEYISSEFTSKLAAMEDKDVKSVVCPKCKRRVSRKLLWFQSAPNTDISVGKCIYHGYVVGRIKFKETGGSDPNVFVMKRVTRTDKKGYEVIKKRKMDLRKKKREKRHQAKGK